jgi:hypothetical protein
MTFSRRSLLTAFLLACCAPALAAPIPVDGAGEIAQENPLLETVRRRRRRRRRRSRHRRRHGRAGWRRPTMNDGWY